MSDGKVRFAPVILAGGSGTRFWPRSRRARAKQVLALDGDATMIQQTLTRLQPVARAEDVWVVTNGWLAATIAEQLPALERDHIVSEPVARNTAPACALMAFLLVREDPEMVMGVFPSDHVVADGTRFAEVIAAGVKLAAAGENIVVLGVPPTRVETGYGYIEQGASVAGEISARRVKRFREKPDRHTAERLPDGGQLCLEWRDLFVACADAGECDQGTCAGYGGSAGEDCGGLGDGEFARVFAETYPEVESISIDYAVLERRSAKGEVRSNIFCLPADFGWNDLGSWASLHEHLGHDEDDNVVDGGTAGLVALESEGNYVYAPGKMVALLGVDGLVVVETDDAILITTRDRSQDVSKVVRQVHVGLGREDLI